MRRVVALMTAIALGVTTFASDLAWAAAETRNASVPVSAISIPAHLGLIRDTWTAPGADAADRTTVIHIQDAHCDYKAQQAIYALIDHLSGSYGARTVLLEGGEGAYDHTPFFNIVDRSLRDRTADYFVREGVINGAELFAIRHPGRVELRGIEDTALYRRNLAIYREMLPHKESIERDLKTINYALAVLKARAWPRELVELDLKRNSFNDRSIDLKEYAAWLVRRAAAQGIDLSALGAVAALFNVLALEKEIDFRRATAERDELIGRLARYLPKEKVRELMARAVAFRAGTLPASEFYAELFMAARTADIDLAAYADLGRYAGYVAVFDSLDKDALFREITVLEKMITERLCADPGQRELDRLSKDLGIIRDIYATTLTPDGFAEFRARRAEFDFTRMIAAIDAAALRYGVVLPAMPDPAVQNARLAQIEQFYALSYERDDVFLRAIKARGRAAEGRVVILVTGGFHTANLARLLQESRISYVSVIPVFRLDETPSPYLALLGGGRPALLGALSSDTSAMAIYAFFCRMAREIYGREVDLGAEWVEAASSILAGKRVAVFDGRVRFVYRLTSPPAEPGERIEEIPGVSVDGARVYAIVSLPRTRSRGAAVSAAGRVVRLVIAGTLIFLSAFGGRPAAAQTGVLSGGSLVAQQGMNTAALDASKLLEDEVTKDILKRFAKLKDVMALTEKVERAARYLEMIPPERVALYKELAEKAGVDPNIFYALEGVETNFSAVLEPDDLTKQINSIGANGPIQVMLAPLNYINDTLIKAWDEEIDRKIENLVAKRLKASVELYLSTAEAEMRKVSGKDLGRFKSQEEVRIRGEIDPDKEGITLDSEADRPKYEVVRRFGFARHNYIDVKAIPPLIKTGERKETDKKTGKTKKVIVYKKNKKYNMRKAIEAGALVMALNKLEFSTKRLVGSPKGGYALQEKDADGKDPGFDVMLAVLTAYNGGPDDADYGLVHAGSRADYPDQKEWYRNYLASVEKLQLDRLKKQEEKKKPKDRRKVLEAEGPGHSVKFSLNQYLIYVILTHNSDLASVLQDLMTPNSIFLNDKTMPAEPMQAEPLPGPVAEAPAPPATPEIQETPLPPQDAIAPIDEEDPNMLLEPLEEVSVVEDEAPAQAPAEAGVSQPAETGSAWYGTFMTAALAVVIGLAGALGFRYIWRMARKEQQRAAGAEIPAPFLRGRIYDARFIAREKADPRFTVVFDMDDTLVWGNPDLKVYYLRPYVRATLELLANRDDVKCVLWTSATRKWTREVLSQFFTDEELRRFFAHIITRENYTPPGVWEGLKHRRLFREFGTTVKDLSLLGYDVLVDDSRMMGHVDRELGFKTILVSPFNFDSIVTKKGPAGAVSPGETPEIVIDEKQLDRMMEDTDMMLKVLGGLRPILPPLPASDGQIGHAKAAVTPDKKRLVIRDTSGHDNAVELVPRGRVDIAALKSALAGLPGVTNDHKETLLSMVSLLEASPPEFYTYMPDEENTVDDVFGIADPGKGLIALHQNLATDPLALFHEVGEYLVRSGAIRLRVRTGRVTIDVVGSPAGPITIALTGRDARDLSRRGRLNPHYALRALQRELLGQRDAQFSGRISVLQAELSTPAAERAYRDVVDAYVRVMMSRYLQDDNPIFYPEKFAVIFRKHYPALDRRARVAFEHMMKCLGQWKWREVFWAACVSPGYVWRRPAADLQRMCSELAVRPNVSQIATLQIHMDIIEYLDDDLAMIPEDIRSDLQEAAMLVNAWVREGEGVDRTPAEFVRHVQWLHAVAGRSLPHTMIERGLSRPRTVDVRNAQRPLIFPSPHDLNGCLRVLAEDVCSASFQGRHPVVQAAEIYLRLTDMQYFSDGNRRVAKLMMDYYLMRYHLPALEITPENKDEFVEVARFMKRPEDLADFMARQLLAQNQALESRGAVLYTVTPPEETVRDHVRVYRDDDALLSAAADEIRVAIDALRDGETANILVSPSGATMRRFFRHELARRANLDRADPDYIDLTRVCFIFATELLFSPEQYRYFRDIVMPLLPEGNRPRDIVHFDDSTVTPRASIDGFKARLAALGPIHLALLALGPEGQLAYNEHGTSYMSHSRIAKLKSASRYYGEFDHKAAFTVGLSEILGAAKITIIGMTHVPDSEEHLLRLFDKSLAVSRAVKALDVPASAVRMKPDRKFVFLLDEASAAGLEGAPFAEERAPRTGRGGPSGPIAEGAARLAPVLADSYVMEKPCTVGLVVKGKAGTATDAILEQKFAREMEIMGRRYNQKVIIDRGLAQYQAGAVTYVVYVDDGTDSDENVARLAAFRARLVAAGNPKSRTFAWVLTNRQRAQGVPPKVAAVGLGDVANLVGLDGDYLPVTWQILVGPLFANLIDSKQPRAQGINQDRVDALVDSIIASLSAMTRTDIAAWDSLRAELRHMSAAELARKLNGTSLVITLPPMVPVSGGVEACRASDIAVMTSL